MDQDSFRQLLQTTAAAKTPTGGATPVPNNPKAKVLDASQPAFKPRKVKKNEDKGYRDRAAERRTGGANDYKEVEAILEVFEKQHAGEDKAIVDSQRRYLGGDGVHSILVKGLDMALVEQNRARAAAQESRADDEDLENAFLERSQSRSPPPPPPPPPPLRASEGDTTTKKRTRAELIRELKAKRGALPPATTTPSVEAKEGEKERTKEEEAKKLEEAKRAGKFRPIGFKPIESSSSEVKKKKKKKKGKTEGEGEKEKGKKKETLKAEAGEKEIQNAMEPTVAPPTTTTITDVPPKQPEVPEPEPPLGDFDIFAGVGEYEGLELGSDDDDDHDVDDEAAGPSTRGKNGQPNIDTNLEEGEELESPSLPLLVSATGSRKWIDTGSPEPEPKPSNPDLLKSILHSSSTKNGKGKDVDKSRPENEEAEEGELGTTRLVPLASSALPSVKDFLAMEAAAGGHGKRRKRKRGGGGGGGGDDGEDKKRSTEAKVERDYKRLKSYTDKKGAK